MRRLAICALVGLTACGGSDGAPTRADRYPPHTDPQLIEALGGRVEPLGVRMVRAGLLEAREDAGYRRSPTGTHLALYVEPVGELDTGGYVANIVPLTRALVPHLFERWPALESFDICQEPAPGADDSPVPPPVTQVTVERTAAFDLDWERLQLVDLLEMEIRGVLHGEPPPVDILATVEVERDPAYQEALRLAESRART